MLSTLLWVRNSASQFPWSSCCLHSHLFRLKIGKAKSLAKGYTAKVQILDWKILTGQASEPIVVATKPRDSRKGNRL